MGDRGNTPSAALRGSLRSLIDWLFGPRTVRARSVIGSGSHSWDAIFHCGGCICSDEVLTYEVERIPVGLGMRWKCECGRMRAITPKQVAMMQRQIAQDAEAESPIPTPSEGPSDA